MEPEHEIPQPAETGSAGKQAESTEIAAVELPTSQLQLLTTVHVLDGLAAANPSRFGGIVGTQLLLSIVSQLTIDRDQARGELREARHENTELREQLATAKSRVAVLEARAGSYSNRARFIGLCAFLGPILIGVSIEIYKNKLAELAVVVGGAGAILLATATVLMWRTGK